MPPSSRTTTSLAATALALSALAATWAPPANDAHTVYAIDGAEGSLYGWAVSDLADVDGDGASDWITGGVIEGDALNGSVELRSGATGALLHRRDGDAWGLLGYAFADVGDTDGDGVHDVAVGAPGAGVVGYVEVLSGATGAVLHRLDGDGPGDFFGAAVGDAGDVDGDGAADLLVGAPRTTAGGEVQVVSGATGAVLRTYTSPEPGARFGNGLDAAGDLDGDGHVEHLVGASDAGPHDAGAAYVFDGATGALRLTLSAAPGGDEFGRFFVAGVGDTDGDDVPDLYVGDYADDTDGPDAGSATMFSGADGSVLHRFVGAPGDGTGPGRSAGDLDRDGRPDLVVGSYTASAAAPGAGAVTVYSGRTGAQLLRVESDRADEQLGFDAVGLGDVTGDGKGDLLVSAANGDRVYVFRGSGVRTTG